MLHKNPLPFHPFRQPRKGRRGVGNKLQRNLKPSNIMDTKQKLVHALTRYDERESKKRGWNPYALGIYLARIDEVMEDIKKGASIPEAIQAGFTGRLQSVCLKAVGASPVAEKPCSAWHYVPASQR